MSSYSSYYSFLLILFLSLIYFSYASKPIGSGRGWNDNIEWYSYTEGLDHAKETGKNMFFIFHSTHCGACKRLKPDFANNKDIEKYSKDFVMVNVQDSEEGSQYKTFQKDGAYIPRIYFADSTGTPDYSITSGNSKYKYFYGESISIANQMKTLVVNNS